MSTDEPTADVVETRLGRSDFIYMTSFRIAGYLGAIAFLWLALVFGRDDWQVGLGFGGMAVFCGCTGVGLGHYLKRNRIRGRRWLSVGFGALGLVILGLTVTVSDGGAGLTWKRVAMVAVAAAMIGSPVWVLGRPAPPKSDQPLRR